jgi:hypothetical protein
MQGVKQRSQAPGTRVEGLAHTLIGQAEKVEPVNVQHARGLVGLRLT